MNVALNTKNAYFGAYQKKSMEKNSPFKANPASQFEDKNKNSRLTEKIKGLNRTESAYEYRGHKESDENEQSFISKDFKNHTYTDTSEGKVNGYLNTNTVLKSNKSTEGQFKKKLNYNYRDISSQILRAKDPRAAGQACLKAKRNLIMLKRKLSNKDIDTDELKTAINHAKAMERVAKRKKRNLELEELCEITGKQDERRGEREKGPTERGIEFSQIEEAKDEISDKLSEIDEYETELLMDSYETDSFDMDSFEDEMGDMSELLSDFSEEEEEALNEKLEALDLMEFVNPHMSEEDLKDLKLKHRSSEKKEIVKAEMEYLKQTFDRLSQEKASGNFMPSVNSAPVFSAVSMPSAADLVSSSVDVSM